MLNVDTAIKLDKKKSYDMLEWNLLTNAFMILLFARMDQLGHKMNNHDNL